MADRPKTDGVGYKRPPDHTKFRPGHSGNPKGRPKQHRNLATDLREELAQLIPIREDRKACRVTKQRAFVKGLIQRAVNGDARAVNSLVALCARTFLQAEDPSKKPLPTIRTLSKISFDARRNASRHPRVPVKQRTLRNEVVVSRHSPSGLFDVFS
jgi:hypothetical protein